MAKEEAALGRLAVSKRFPLGVMQPQKWQHLEGAGTPRKVLTVGGMSKGKDGQDKNLPGQM